MNVRIDIRDTIVKKFSRLIDIDSSLTDVFYQYYNSLRVERIIMNRTFANVLKEENYVIERRWWNILDTG